MPEPASFPYSPSYEQACDRLIAMCNGDPRSTIKALIRASSLGAVARRARARSDTA